MGLGGRVTSGLGGSSGPWAFGGAGMSRAGAQAFDLGGGAKLLSLLAPFGGGGVYVPSSDGNPHGGLRRCGGIQGRC